MDGLTSGAQENRAQIADIRRRLLWGQITYDMARVEARPILARINARGAEIARENGFKYRPISLAALLR